MNGLLPISVVIPAYNSAALIGDALASVAAQTLPPAEVIVVDDGSTDETAAIAESFGAVVLRRPNGGAAAARNAGLARAREPWIALLDADDVWRAEKLERQWAAHLLQPSAGLIVCDRCETRDGVVVRRSTLKSVPSYRNLHARRIDTDTVFAEGTTFGRALCESNFLSTSTVLVRRDVVEETGGFSETLPQGAGFLIGEDWEWYLRLLRSTSAVVVELPLLELRKQSDSLSADFARMCRGDIVLGERVIANPGRYVAGAAEAFARGAGRRDRQAVLADIRQHRFRAARGLAKQSFAARPSPTTFVLGLAAVLLDAPWGGPAISAARGLWRARHKPRTRPESPAQRS